METDKAEQLIREAIARFNPGNTIASVEHLSTLPHSAVSRIVMSDGQRLILKRAGSAEFAAGMRKEFIINRDVLSQLPNKVAPRMLGGQEDVEIPYLIFEDSAVSHQPLSVATPPGYSYLERFVSTLAKAHAQSKHIDLEAAFSNVQGDVRVTDGSEYVPAVLDAFLHSKDRDQLPASAFTLIEKVRDNIPQIADLLSGQACLIHGDAHAGNALYADDAVLLDWALTVIGPGEVDLCHLLALNLPRYFASEYEPALIRRYVEVCANHDVTLSEEGVLARYRQCLLMTVIVAVGMQTVAGMPKTVGSYLFTNAVHSAMDHNIMEFLD
ncbi:MAG: aminoglycoside phosphotransferase family protein [Pseudomonadota bacterium]